MNNDRRLKVDRHDVVLRASKRGETVCWRGTCRRSFCWLVLTSEMVRVMFDPLDYLLADILKGVLPMVHIQVTYK